MSPHELVLAEAQRYLRTAEDPKGSNRGLRIDYWCDAVGSPLGSAWCMAFVWQVFVQALGRARVPIHRSGRVQDVVDAATQRGWLTTDLAQARPGDLLVLWYPTLKPARYGHVAVIESVAPSLVVSIDGNTAPNVAAGSAADREGYVVDRKRRTPSARFAAIRWELAA